MKESLKLKYRAYCRNPKEFYKIVEDWNTLTWTNAHLTKEDKLNEIEKYKESYKELYQIMKEDINHGLL